MIGRHAYACSCYIELGLAMSEMMNNLNQWFLLPIFKLLDPAWHPEALDQIKGKLS